MQCESIQLAFVRITLAECGGQRGGLLRKRSKRKAVAMTRQEIRTNPGQWPLQSCQKTFSGHHTSTILHSIVICFLVYSHDV